MKAYGNSVQIKYHLGCNNDDKTEVIKYQHISVYNVMWKQVCVHIFHLARASESKTWNTVCNGVHNDVMTLLASPMDSPHQGPVPWSFDDFFIVWLNNGLNKQSIYQLRCLRVDRVPQYWVSHKIEYFESIIPQTYPGVFFYVKTLSIFHQALWPLV